MKTWNILPPPPHSIYHAFFIKVETELLQNAIINCGVFKDYNEWLFLKNDEFNFIVNKVKSMNVRFDLEKSKDSVEYGRADFYVYKLNVYHYNRLVHVEGAKSEVKYYAY